MTLSDIAIKRPVFTTMVSLGIVVLGLMGLSRLGVNLFPDVQFPVVTVTTVYPGASPSEVETQVTEKLEDAIVSLPGVDNIQSFSRDSVSILVIEFALDVDIMEAATLTRERVAQTRALLPRDVEEPTVARIDIGAAPIMTYTLAGPVDVQELRRFATDDLRPILEQIDGVASVNVLGGRERQINVLLDLDRIQGIGMTPLAIVERIRSSNMSVPAGGFDEGERRISVRTLGEIQSVEELRMLPLGNGPDGSIVRLRDVATVEDGFVDEETVVRANAAPAVVFEVQKASGANTVAVSEAVRERLAELEMPDGIRANLIIDQAEFILENTHEVEIALFFGGAMAILIILVFLLDLRSTFISSLALPTSVLGAFFLMFVLDFTLNMMTLLGLSLAIGLLIDDSIVVRENIMKHLERGEDPVTAASKGTREITLAVLATTATLCAVFVPIAFTGGLVGQFFREFGLTVAGATVFSAWVAFTLDPMLSARLAVQHAASHDEHAGFFGFITRPMQRFYEAIDGIYYGLLRWMLARKRRMALIAALAFGMLFGSGALVPMMGNEFVSPEDRGQFNVDIELPAGTRLEETARLSLAAEQELVQDPLFVTVYARAGAAGRPNFITWRIVAVPKTERTETQDDLKARVRELLRRHMPAAEISISDPGIIEGGRDYPIQINVAGEDLDQIAAVAERYGEILRSIPGTQDVDVQYQPGSPELAIDVDRDRASQLGIPLALVAMTARASIEGEVAGVFRDRELDEEVDIRVRLQESDRSSALLVANLRLPTPGGFVPLSDVASVRRTDGPSEIQHFNRQRVVVVTASPAGRPLSDIVDEFEARLRQEPPTPGVHYVWRGQVERMNESNENMLLALLLGFVFIYLVLASQFESFMHPATIMTALPLALVGAIVALFLQGSSISMGAMIGIILLMGLVTKNGILLVDHAVSKVREEGLPPMQAIMDAGPARLRPIVMTSAAMVLGMLPTALGDGPGSEFRGPMAMSVIGGVISSTLLTLVVVPVFFLMFDGLKNFVIRWVFGRASGGPPTEKTKNVELMAELIVVSPLYLFMTLALAALFV
ncbi:MAG: efflux RND transporter permease subunit [Sandaracinaceae bacterium]